MKKMLPLGYAFTMSTTISYAVPSGQVLITVKGSGALQLSNDDSTYTTPTLTNETILTSARFAKTTTAALVVSVQKV